jgi:hypothetical protein
VQNSYNKIIAIIVLFLIVVSVQVSYSASGRRKHFLSHGPSVASFGAGESVFSAYKDPASLQYNSSLMAFFNDNAVSLSRFNLFEGASYNSGSLAIGFGRNFFVGLSVSDLSSGNLEIRENIYSQEKIISVNTWSYILSFAGLMDTLNIAYGLNVKYLYYDFCLKYGGTYLLDCGFSKDVPVKDILKIKLGLSCQNFVSGKLKLDSQTDDIPVIYRLSSAFIIPTYHRFKSKDTINIYADLKYEDDFADFYGGLAYIFTDKYILRAGYYPHHITFGAGIDFYCLTLDYSADFGEVDLINRFGLTYRWQLKKSDLLLQEANSALSKEKIELKHAEEKFKKVKLLYNNKEYLRATDMLSDLILSYPNYNSPNYFYKEITSIMNKNANNDDELDFGKITYARAYISYYRADYKEALNEWKKYVSFTGGTDEVLEYSKKIDTILEIEEFEKREKELNKQAEKILKDGIEKYNLRKWIHCIKKMEQLEKFVIKNNFSKALEYNDKAKEYISKSVLELSKSVLVKNNSEEHSEEKYEYDEITSDKKYTEGLVLYAQGKYYEAERSWELTLRLNPRHKKAKIALGKLKKYIQK